MAGKTTMNDTFEKEGFMYLTTLIRQSSAAPADSGSCPLNPVGCIVFSKPCRSKRVNAKSRIDLPAILFCTDVNIQIFEATSTAVYGDIPNPSRYFPAKSKRPLDMEEI